MSFKIPFSYRLLRVLYESLRVLYYYTFVNCGIAVVGGGCRLDPAYGMDFDLSMGKDTPTEGERDTGGEGDADSSIADWAEERREGESI